MSVQQYKAVSGQSIYDVCNQTYGSLDFLIKMIQESGHVNVDSKVLSGEVFNYDDELVIDTNIYQQTTINNIRYATDLGNNGSVFYVVEQNPNQNTNPNTNPATPVNPITPVMYSYEKTSQTIYVIGADGEALISLVDLDGNPLTDKTILQIEKETKPMKPTEYVYNSNNAQLAMLFPGEVYAGQTLFILYKETITVS